MFSRTFTNRLYSLIAIFPILSLCFIAVADDADTLRIQQLVENIYQASKPDFPVNSYAVNMVTVLTGGKVIYLDKIYKTGGKIRITTRLSDGTHTILAFNGKTAWFQDANGQKRLLSEKETNYLRFSAAVANPHGKLSECFEKIILSKNPETIGAESCVKLTCIPFSHYGQMPVVYYISKKDFLPRRTEMISFSQGTALPMTSLYSNYQKFAGLLFPAETRTTTPQSQVLSKIISVNVNQKIDDIQFEPAKDTLPWSSLTL